MMNEYWYLITKDIIIPSCGILAGIIGASFAIRKYKLTEKIEGNKKIIECLYKISYFLAKYDILRFNIDNINIQDEINIISKLYNDLLSTHQIYRKYTKISDEKIHKIGKMITEFNGDMMYLYTSFEEYNRFSHNGTFKESEMAQKIKKEIRIFMYGSNLENKDKSFLSKTNDIRILIQSIIYEKNYLKLKNESNKR